MNRQGCSDNVDKYSKICSSCNGVSRKELKRSELTVGGRGCRKKWQRRKQSRRFSEPDVLDCGATNPADRVVLGLLVDNMATVVVAFELVNEQAVVMAHHVGEGDKSTVL